MQLEFTKYQGTGNDFVVIDNRTGIFPHEDLELVRRLCDRRLGVGADGLMLIEDHETQAFCMIYYNSDGSQSLCGNGSRCAVHFAKDLGLIGKHTSFVTTDGEHKAYLKDGWVHFQLHNVNSIREMGEDYFIDTGSPHYVRFVDRTEEVNVQETGSEIRYSETFHPDGTNVNFVQITAAGIKVRTYERGVEGETQSCGTGVTAAAIAASLKGLESPIAIETPGGTLSVSFTTEGKSFTQVFLAGPATKVFTGKIEV
ncbi:MAG: diaminopimelate epimerase [Cyclobacteriaceae bacterium]|nr:diaminopimelate epimerase [Cyclobacteriaceae bacterium HetDA_MAG_MS6]